MADFREQITLDPISSERMDCAGNIHRYNFGWLETKTIVGEKALPPSGANTALIETSTTRIAGQSISFEESVVQIMHPASLKKPKISSNISMTNSIDITTYTKVGTKYRTMIRSRASGKSELIGLGSNDFALIETKSYAGAIGTGAVVNPAVEEYSDSGASIVVANGVKTETQLKG